MASCGYHSPQFSEDIAFLPPWLQPHQLPVFGDGVKDKRAISQLSCKNLASLPNNVSDGQAGQLFTEGVAKYSGCCLYLSGGDTSRDESPSFSAQTLQFHLHLSALGDSELSTSQLNEVPQLKNPGTNERSPKNYLHQNPAIQDATNCQDKSEDRAPATKSQSENKSRMSQTRRILQPLVTTNHKNQHRFKGKPDAGKISNADINDAIELSIAASEAMVISDMVSSSLQSENLPSSSILEIALRVKQARKEAVSSFRADEFGEADMLSDLDDNAMAYAFDDVGVSFTQNTDSLDDSRFREKSLQLNPSYDTKTHVSESQFGNKEEAQISSVKALATDANGASLQSHGAFVPLDCIKSCSESQPKVEADNLHQNADILIPAQMGPKEDEEIHKDGKVSKLGNDIIQKNLKVRNWETSFISESMDVIDESTSEHIAESKHGIIASSRTPCRELPFYRESERSIHGGYVLSQDFARSPSLSLVDPLCSLVPCSISADYGENFVEPAREAAKKETTLNPLTEGASVCSIGEVPVVPTRKQSNSLANYSRVMPDPNTTLQNVFNYRPSPSHNTNKELIQFLNREFLKPMDGNKDVDGSEDNHGDDKDDDSGFLIHHHEERGRCSPIILNCKKRRLRACKDLIFNDGGEENFKKYSESKMRKCKIVNPINEEVTNSESCVPKHSSLRLELGSKQCAHDKRVRFLEAKSSLDRTKNSKRMQFKNRTHGSHQRSSKRVKKSSLVDKSASGKVNYDTIQHSVREKGMIFQGLEFLLTGFSSQKEKELAALIRLYGGYVLLNIPANRPDLRGKQLAGLAREKLPIVLSPKKVQTTKYLYGCATNAWMLNADWLVDSIHAGYLLPPGKYMTRLIQGSQTNQSRVGEPFCLNDHTYIFARVGILLNGKVSFCTKFTKIIKHGGGQIYKSLQGLIQSVKDGNNTLGAVLVENESHVSRHLKHCALESNLQTVPSSWVVNSLFSDKLLPFKKDRYAPLHRIKMPMFPVAQDEEMSEEI